MSDLEKAAQQEPVACRYGDNGYACCEGGPCAAEEHNDKTDWQERGMVAEAALAKLLDEKQEPVAWATQLGEYAHIKWGSKRPEYPMVYEFPLYTRPQAREPKQPAQDEPVGEVIDERGEVDWISFVPPAGTFLYTRQCNCKECPCNKQN